MAPIRLLAFFLLARPASVCLNGSWTQANVGDPLLLDADPLLTPSACDCQNVEGGVLSLVLKRLGAVVDTQRGKHAVPLYVVVESSPFQVFFGFVGWLVIGGPGVLFSVGCNMPLMSPSRFLVELPATPDRKCFKAEVVHRWSSPRAP